MSARHSGRAAVQTAALVAGVGLILLGILGFTPGITQHYERMRFSGPDSDADLMGLAHVSVLLNTSRILIGAVGVALAGVTMIGSPAAARRFLVGAGGLHICAAVYGAAINQASQANFLPANRPGNWLNGAVGLAMLGGAVLTWRSASAATATPGPPRRSPDPPRPQPAARADS